MSAENRNGTLGSTLLPGRSFWPGIASGLRSTLRRILIGLRSNTGANCQMEETGGPEQANLSIARATYG